MQLNAFKTHPSPFIYQSFIWEWLPELQVGFLYAYGDWTDVRVWRILDIFLITESISQIPNRGPGSTSDLQILQFLSAPKNTGGLIEADDHHQRQGPVWNPRRDLLSFMPGQINGLVMKGLEPDEVSRNTLLAAVGSAERWQTAMQLRHLDCRLQFVSEDCWWRIHLFWSAAIQTIDQDRLRWVLGRKSCTIGQVENIFV